MFAPFAYFFFLLLLSPLVTPELNEINCINLHVPRPDLADCQTAIDMIPSGDYHWDGKKSRRLSFNLPDSVRQRKFFFPAAFRSNTCVVKMERMMNPPGGPTQGTKAATAMYNTVWPNVRHLCTKMVERCLATTEMAFVVTQSNVGTFPFTYLVSIGGIEPNMPGDGWKMSDSRAVYNVYEAGGTASGHGTLGVKSLYRDP